MEEKTAIVWVTPEVSKALQLGKKSFGVRSANDVLWAIMEDHAPELLERARKTLAAERGE